MSWLQNVGQRAGKLWDNIASVVAPVPDDQSQQQVSFRRLHADVPVKVSLRIETSSIATLRNSTTTLGPHHLTCEWYRSVLACCRDLMVRPCEATLAPATLRQDLMGVNQVTRVTSRRRGTRAISRVITATRLNNNNRPSPAHGALNSQHPLGIRMVACKADINCRAVQQDRRFTPPRRRLRRLLHWDRLLRCR